MALLTTGRRGRILLVCDRLGDCDVERHLADGGFATDVVADEATARAALAGGRCDLVVIACGDGGGWAGLLSHIRSAHRGTGVVFVASRASVAGAVEAMRRGAADYLAGPVESGRLLRAVRLALADRPEAALADGQAGAAGAGAGIVSQDAAMANVFRLMDAVADSRSTVLVTGESGTGKSMVARAIHRASARRDGPFVEVACGAMPDTLLESELFGHVRGAFTGAVSDKQGKFAAADGGTIFLDEIATASGQLQVKLLRVLQERRLEPVGSNETVDVDVRVILATNHDLAAEVKAGSFRGDLFYRVNVINIELPPLRQRPADVELLAEHFLEQTLRHTPRNVAGFSPEAMGLMRSYGWPGNVRELENAVERAVVLSRGPLVMPADLPAAIAEHAAADGPGQRSGPTLKAALAEPEKQIIARAIKDAGGNRRQAARMLGINRATLYKKMRRLGMASGDV